MIPGHRGGAWSPDGLSHYNEILAAVRVNCCSEEGVMFEKDLQDELPVPPGQALARSKCHQSVPEVEVVKVSDDLGDLVAQAAD